MVLDRPLGTFSIEEFPVPDPAPGTVLLRMELSGCCATDAHTYLGQWKNAAFPALLGHENVGSVVAVGVGGQRDYLSRDLEPGDRVFARWGWCGQCYECRTLQQPRRCRNRSISYGGMGADMPFSGGFAEYLYLSAPQTTFMLKLDVPPSTAVLSEPLGVAVTAVRRAQPRMGETIVVQGCGAIGLLTLGLASYDDAVVAGRIMEQRQLPLERLVSHQLPLERVGDAIEALNSTFSIDGRTALKIAIAPNGPVA